MSTHGEKWVPLHQLKHPLAIADNRNFEKVGVFGDPVAKIVGDAEEGSAMVDFAEREKRVLQWWISISVPHLSISYLSTT